VEILVLHGRDKVKACRDDVLDAMLAAESMGLGSCLIGMVGPFLSRNKKLKEKYGVPPRNRPGIAIVFGYPDIRYRRTVKRRLARVHYP